ncbi:unnamed protein product [Psylliodes chrysocephalus]|uniref:Uncharacterized protein n=1 Tax=Psylliodes chrysocephalus TaxID=3402493 RepID=A0A9P0CUG7_9CUCU|nr:unnamed protein product [Psylliodes chrysocephala]
MTLKSLTSSRKVVEIINRYGHCCSYHVAKELETETTYASSQRSATCPEGIIRTKGLHTGLAFDNFDGFVDTSSAENAAVFDKELSLDVDEASVNFGPGEIWARGGRKRRRSLEAIIPNIQPYNK